jgi:Na+/H+ antiporter NhaC
MGGNRTGCSGCLTILILLFALGLMSEAWQGMGTGGRVAMVLIGVAVLGGLGVVDHAVVTSETFKAKAAKR